MHFESNWLKLFSFNSFIHLFFPLKCQNAIYMPTQWLFFIRIFNDIVADSSFKIYFMERCPWSQKSTSASNIINSIKSVCAKTNKSKQKKCALVFFIVNRTVLCSRWYFCGAMLKKTTIWRQKQLAHWAHIMHNK